MTEKKPREAEKSPLTMSFNAKEESLLKKKILSLDSMKKQAADSLTLDQKILYNQFTLKLRRSELAHAKLLGNRDLIKHLARTMFSNLNTTLNDGTEEAVRAILQNGKSPRAVSAPCRPTSRMSEKDRSYRTDISHGCESKGMDFSTRKTYPNTSQRFYSAPGRRRSGNRQTQVKFLEKDELKSQCLDTPVHPLSQTSSMAPKQNSLTVEVSGTEIMEFKQFPRTEDETLANDTKWPASNTSLVRKRPKSTSFLLNNGGSKLQSSSSIMKKMVVDREDHFENKVKLFIEKVKSMQQHDSTLRDYYSQRMLDGTGKKEISTLASKEEQNQWLPVGEETQHRSVTIKKLDRNFTRKDVPIDILFMEQYNMVLTKENYSVRNWINNNPYISAE